MGRPPSQKELSELEQSDSPYRELLETIAKFLRVDLKDVNTFFESEPRLETVRKAFGPREEFCLKLLLKKVSSSPSKNNDHIELYKEFWLLLLHIIESIPIRSIAQILGERDFLEILETRASVILSHGKGHVSEIQTEGCHESTQTQPRKKRKVSSTTSSNDPHPKTRTTSTDMTHVQLLILAVVRSLTGLAKRDPKIDDASSHSIRTVLSATAEKAASITGKLFRMINQSAMTSSKLHGTAMEIVLIWQYRRSDSDIADVRASDRAFTRNALQPTLDFLALSSHALTQDIGAQTLVEKLERLVAVHSVLPLRALFQAERASQWKSKSTTITWDDIKDLYEVVGSALIGVEYLQTEDFGINSASVSSSIQTFLDIAIRAVPRSTLRRVQTEQPWLDCLFSVSAYLVSPGLPRMVTNWDGLLEEVQTTDAKAPGDSVDGVCDLLSLSLKRGVAISLPVLVYFASATLATAGTAPAWTVIAGILKQDVNILLPKSGLLNAVPLLDQVCKMVSGGGRVSKDDYTMVLDELVKPLLAGFVQARDLKGFVTVWLNGLEDSMQQRASGEIDFNSLYCCLVWEDEAIFTDFEIVCRTFGTSKFAGEFFADLLRGLKKIGTRIGPTVDVVSRIAVAEALLKASTEDNLPSSDVIEEMMAATISALQRRSDYQHQRWRLWAFLRRCMLLQQEKASYEKRMNQLNDLGIVVSLPSSQEISGMPPGYARSACLQEALECFHIRVVQDKFSNNIGHGEPRESEIKELIALFYCKGEPSKRNTGTRHLKQMQTSLDLVWACTSILLADTHILHDAPSATGLLVSAMIQSLDSHIDPYSGTQRLLRTLLADDIAMNGLEAFNQGCALLSTLKDATGHLPSYARDILISLPLGSLKNPLAESLAERLLIELQTDGPATSPPDTLANLVLLEAVTKASSVSIGKPQNWRRLPDLTDAVFSNLQSMDSIRTMICPLRNIFHQIWQRILQAEKNASTKTLIQDIHAWCMARIDHLVTDEYTPSDFVVLTSLVNGLCLEMRNSSLELTPKELKNLRKDHTQMLVHQLQKLAGLKLLNEQETVSLLLVAEAANNCQDLGSLEIFKSVQFAIDGAIRRWTESLQGSDMLPLVSTKLENARYQLRQLAQLDNQRLLTQHDIEEELENLAGEVTIGQLARKATRLVELNGPENLSRLLDTIEQRDLDSKTFILIGAIVCQISSEDIAQNSLLAAHISRLATLRFATQAQTATNACIALESCIFILDRQPQVVNQWTIDALLGSVAHLASPGSLRLVSTDNPSAIFNKLCSITGLALARFRKRIGGRYHLLLPALRALLRCLFYAGSGPNARLQTKQQVIFARSLPHWLTSSKNPLPPSSADSFTRILTTICDPSASSVRSSRKRTASSELTDETKKARSLAGQYMQYLVMEYSKCILNGRIGPELKEKLMPGLYALMDVMGREVMRGMNAAMDSSSRAIFKTLYDDYQRHGRWNQS